MIEYLDYMHEEYATCQFCGHKESDSWELSDTHEIECECGGVYTVEREFEVTYSSYPKTPPEIEPLMEG